MAFGHADIMDLWYPMGSHDMLEVAHMGAHCLQMMGTSQLKTIFEVMTGRGAKVLKLLNYGIQAGCTANLVVLQVKSCVDAIRLRPARLCYQPRQSGGDYIPCIFYSAARAGKQ